MWRKPWQLKRLFWIASLLLVWCPVAKAQLSAFTDRAVGVNPFPTGPGLVPIAYGGVRVCSTPTTQAQPCLPLANIFDNNGNAISNAIGGSFGQLTTDVTGKFSFQCTAGLFQIQVAPSASNTPQLNYQATCPALGSSFTAITANASTNQVILGTVPNQTTLNAPAPTGNITLNFPVIGDTMVGRTTTDTLTNKTLTSPTVNTPTISSPTISGVTTDSSVYTQTGAYTVGKWNQVRVLDGLTFTTLAAIQTDCPAGGCTVIIPVGATLDASVLAITKPMRLVFAPGSFAFNGFSCTTGTEGVRISGSNRGGSGTTQGTVLTVASTTLVAMNFTNCPGVEIDHLTLVGPGSGTGKGIVISGTRPKLDSVLVSSFGSDGITLDGTTINTNLGTIVHVRSQNNLGHGFKTLGANANVTQFVGADAGGNGGDGFNIATGGNVFNGTNTSANTPNGYHFLSGAVKNAGFIFSDAPNGTETKALVFDAGANNNVLYPVMSLTAALLTDNGSGNRYLHFTTDSAWSALTVSSGSAGGGTTLGSLNGPATINTVNFPATGATQTAAVLGLAQTWTANQTNVPLVTPTIGGGTTLTKYSRFAVSLSPAAVAANTCAAQSFTVTGIAAADILISVVKPTEQAGLTAGPGHVTAVNTATVNFCNTTAASITPTAAETYQFVTVQ